MWQGHRDGLVKTACSFAGFVLGLVVAYMFYTVVGEKIAPHLGKDAQTAPIIAFILLWIAVPIAFNFAGIVLTRMVETLHLSMPNRLAGSGLGAIKYFLGATLVLYALVMMDKISGQTVHDSFFGDKMINLAEHIMERFREVKG